MSFWKLAVRMYLRYTYNLVKVMRLKSMKGKISSLTQNSFFHSVKFKGITVITGEFSCLLQCKIPIDFLFFAKIFICTPSNEPCWNPDVFIYKHRMILDHGWKNIIGQGLIKMYFFFWPGTEGGKNEKLMLIKISLFLSFLYQNWTDLMLLTVCRSKRSLCDTKQCSM